MAGEKERGLKFQYYWKKENMTEPKMRWYTADPTNAKDLDAVIDQLKTLVVDETGAKVEKDSRKTEVHVYTALTWDFLRELMPNCLVSIANHMENNPWR